MFYRAIDFEFARFKRSQIKRQFNVFPLCLPLGMFVPNGVANVTRFWIGERENEVFFRRENKKGRVVGALEGDSLREWGVVALY